MANAWNELSWGLGYWGLQSDELIIPTGVVSSVSVNSIDYAGEPNGWGQFTWGFNEWGDLINPTVAVTGLQLNTLVGNEEAFIDVNVLVTGEILSTTLDSVSITGTADLTLDTNLATLSQGDTQGIPGVVVSVTTPGSPTTWGQSNFGSYSWSQIIGTQLELGDEFAFTDISVLLNGNQLTVTLDPNYEILLGIIEEVDGVLITSAVNSVFAGELIITNVTGVTINSTSGTLVINADANVTPNTNLLNITIGDESITGDANLTLSTNLLNAVVGNVDNIIDAVVEVTTPGSPSVWGEFTWGQQGWGRIVGLEVEQGGEEVVVPSIEVDVIGVQLNTSIGSLSITADANLTLNTNLLTTSLGDEEGLPNTIVTLSTNLLNASVGIASGQALVDVAVTGVNMTTSTGRLYVTAWAVVDIGVTNTWAVVDIAA
jgi:hypothetical protein